MNAVHTRGCEVPDAGGTGVPDARESNTPDVRGPALSHARGTPMLLSKGTAVTDVRGVSVSDATGTAVSHVEETAVSVAKGTVVSDTREAAVSDAREAGVSDARGATVSGARQSRRGPAPIASFDHDVSDESSPEAKMTFQLPEIREHRSLAAAPGGAGIGLAAAPRIDISRASSSSHHDSRDSSPELLAAPDGPRGLGFQEDGALELRSSTEELAFLEPESQPVGRSTRGSSVGSVTSALSSASRAPSRAASPHRVQRETSFCGPKPLAAAPDPSPLHAVRALSRPDLLLDPAPAPTPSHHLLTAATIEPIMRRASAPAPAPTPDVSATEVRQPRRKPRRRSDVTCDEPVVHRPENRDKSVIRIRLKPDDQYDDRDDDLDNDRGDDTALAPPDPVRPVPAPARSLAPSPATSRRSSPTASRKSSFCSLFRRSPEPAAPSSRARGSVLALFRPAPRRSPTPGPAIVPPASSPAPDALRYYQSAADGVIHIPLRSPPDELASPRVPVSYATATTTTTTDTTAPTVTATTTTGSTRSRERTVLPDGSVIIPLRSPTDEPTPTESEPESTDVHSAPVPNDIQTENTPEIGADQGERPEPIETAFEFDFGALDREIAAYLASDNGSTAADDPPTPPSEPINEESVNGGDGLAERSSASELGSSPEEPDRRRLVADSDEELPFVATTLPQERSLAWPMRPVRSRSPPPAPRPSRRPRAPPAALPSGRFSPVSAPAAPPLRVRLPPPVRRPPAPAPWVDVSSAPERRPPARRIQTVPAPVSFVEPAECRCECHRSPVADEDELPLIRSRGRAPADGCTSDSSAEGGAISADVADTTYKERA